MRRGLAESRTQAALLIDAGEVLVAGSPAAKAARLVAPDEPILLTGPAPRYVSRGGQKLEAAILAFEIDPSGRVALDAGSSTGGFTDCLLQAGAEAVVAVDVGRGQLHERLRGDPRVIAREQSDIRSFDLHTLAGELDLAGGFPLATADLSFISLRSVAVPLVGLLAPRADLVVLVKPQFEAGRAEVSRGKGVIRDPQAWNGALRNVISAIEEAGAANMGVMVSPLRGADGNVEFLAHFVAAAVVRAAGAVESDIDRAVMSAAAGG